ncbi:MAG: DUF2851 family protein [Limisphaerales bacterium]
MTSAGSNLYAQWRAQEEARWLLRERDSAQPPERLLQSIWRHQRLRRDLLHTLDGQPVRVLHPGFWNREAGPDFRRAIVQFGQDEPREGDIEVDVLPENWQAHQHHTNPAFANVILHVVWNGGGTTAAEAPALAMQGFLDTPVEQMQLWAASGAAENWPESLRGACSVPLAQLPPGQRDDLLRQTARARFERKAGELENRARQAGWEQALWEGIFRALGYKQNVWAMQRVAELLPQLREGANSLLAWQARLLGVSGFLAADPPSAASGAGEYARALWDHWWRERDRFRGVLLPKMLWRMHGLRPANQPQRRLAVAAHWLAAGDLVARLERWFTDAPSSEPLQTSLLACLQPPRDAFWSWHWSFASPCLLKPQPLLGESRATDLAINVILPWFWTRARAGQNERLAGIALERYLLWPEAQDNSLLRLARHRLLGGESASRLKTAAGQQGLLQIVHDFCDHSNALCADCTFPDLVRVWNGNSK